MAASGMSDDSGAGEDTGSSARTADEDGCEKGALAGALPLVAYEALVARYGRIR